MKKILLLLVNLSTYEWNEQNILQQLEYQKDIIENNKDIVIRIDWSVARYYYVDTEYFRYNKFFINKVLRNKEFTKKYLSLFQTYNKIANNYFENKKEINEFINSNDYNFYDIIFVLKAFNIWVPFFIFFENENNNYKSLKNKYEKIYLLLFYLISSCEDVYYSWSNNQLKYGVYLDSLNLTINYENFLLKLVAGMLNVYYYEKDKWVIGSVVYTILIDVLHIICAYKCNKNLNLNKNKYMKLTKKENEEFRVMKMLTFYPAKNYRYHYCDIIFNVDNVDRIDKKSQIDGYMTFIDESEYQAFQNLFKN